MAYNKEYMAEYRKRNREEIRRKHREWCLKNKAKAREHSQNYRAKSGKEIYQRTKGKQKAYAARYRSTAKGHLTKLLGTARKHKRVVVEITTEDLLSLWDNQSGLCLLTGMPMTLGGGRHVPSKASIDRIDQLKGYVKGNVRLVCLWSNIARHVLNDSAFLKLCRAVVDYSEAMSDPCRHGSDMA